MANGRGVRDPPPLTRAIGFELGPTAAREHRKERARLLGGELAVGEGRCGACAGPGGPGLASRLLACGRCFAAWYCSPDCQLAAWPAHRPACRPLRAGDRVLIHSAAQHPELNGQILGVLGRVGDSDVAAGPGTLRRCSRVGDEAGRRWAIERRSLQRVGGAPLGA